MNKFEQKKRECTDPVMLEALDIAAKQHGQDEWPKDGDECWIVYGDGSIRKKHFHADFTHDAYLSTGMVKRTEDEAERKVAQMEAETKVLNAIAKHRGDWRPDWSDCMQDRFHFHYDHEDSEIGINDSYSLQIMRDEQYFPREAYDAIRAELDDETIKTYLGVE